MDFLVYERENTSKQKLLTSWEDGKKANLERTTNFFQRTTDTTFNNTMQCKSKDMKKINTIS